MFKLPDYYSYMMHGFRESQSEDFFNFKHPTVNRADRRRIKAKYRKQNKVNNHVGKS